MGSSTASAGRKTPLMRLTASVAAASVGPVLPADTSASARPSPTAAAACTIEASRFERTAATASSPALTVSGASTISACGPAAPASSAAGPNRRTGSARAGDSLGDRGRPLVGAVRVDRDHSSSVAIPGCCTTTSRPA